MREYQADALVRKAKYGSTTEVRNGRFERLLHASSHKYARPELHCDACQYDALCTALLGLCSECEDNAVAIACTAMIAVLGKAAPWRQSRVRTLPRGLKAGPNIM